MKITKNEQLPLPPHFSPERTGGIWKVDYQQRATDAAGWVEKYEIEPAWQDDPKVALIAIDEQNTFCLPGFELFVAGRSGRAAVDDSRRLCEFIYTNLHRISKIVATLDTHHAIQIFHPIFLVDANGKHPDPNTLISYKDVESGRWMFNPEIAPSLGIDPQYGQQHLLHYAQELKERGKYDLTIWPYHAMLGGIGHALVPAIEEAIFFHSIARNVQTQFEIKGDNALTENYSAVGPEVLDGPGGEVIAKESDSLVRVVLEHDAALIAGQAKSHCVAWTVEDLLRDLTEIDEKLVDRVYLLTDCTSAVVVPGLADYTDLADKAFARFGQAGIHLVRSTDPMSAWLG